VDLVKLQAKLTELQRQLYILETDGAEEIRLKRIAADIGDDFRENELAKDVMNQHDIWYIRKVELKKEIYHLRKQIFQLMKQVS